MTNFKFFRGDTTIYVGNGHLSNTGYHQALEIKGTYRTVTWVDNSNIGPSNTHQIHFGSFLDLIMRHDTIFIISADYETEAPWGWNTSYFNGRMNRVYEINSYVNKYQNSYASIAYKTQL
jgi:hypothetical protein